jgi:hypothetical protein
VGALLLVVLHVFPLLLVSFAAVLASWSVTPQLKHCDSPWEFVLVIGHDIW